MESPVTIGDRELSAEIARAWTRGLVVPQEGDERFFTQEVSEEDYIAHREGIWRLSVAANSLARLVATNGWDEGARSLVEHIENLLQVIKAELKKRDI
jgi:hypothetical protein